MLSNDTAIVLLLADKQREIEALRAEVERLQEALAASTPE